MICATLFLLLLIPVHALVVDDLTDEVEATRTSVEESNAKIMSELEIIKSELRNTPTQTEIDASLNKALAIHQQILFEITVSLVVAAVVIGLLLVGFFYSVYFYFKGQGRI